MPTIDQLAQATAASDTDELLVSQNGAARKVTRRQMVAGLQTQLAVGSGTLLGRSSQGTGDPEQIKLGNNLTLANGVLSAAATPYVVSALPAGTVPGAADLVPLSQGGANTAVPYTQFLAGLAGVAGIDGSGLMVKPTGASASIRLADFAAGALPSAGGTLTGALTLAADPVQPLQPVTKRYADAQAAVALPRSGGTLTGPLVLPADPAQPLQAATKQYADARVQRSGDTMTGPLAVAGGLGFGNVTATPVSYYASPTGTAQLESFLLSAQSVGTGVLQNARIDTSINGAPSFYVWGLTSVVNFLGSGGTGEHVAGYFQAIRSAFGAGGGSNNPQLWAATFESRDATGQPSSATGAQLSVEMDLFANGPDDGAGGAGVRQIQTLAIDRHDPNGADVEVSTGTGYYGGTHTSFKQIVYMGAPFSVAAINMRDSNQLTGANAIWMNDGHSVAFDRAGTYRVYYTPNGFGARGPMIESSQTIGARNFESYRVGGGATVNPPAYRGEQEGTSDLDGPNSRGQFFGYLTVNNGGGNAGDSYANARFDTLVTNNATSGKGPVNGVASVIATINAQAVKPAANTQGAIALSGSAARASGNLAIWGALIAATDSTFLKSSVSGPLRGIEVDCYACDADDAGQRIGVALALNHDGPPATAGYSAGVSVACDPQSYAGSMFRASGPYANAVFDASAATPVTGRAPGLLLAQNQAVAFTADAKWQMFYDSASARAVVTYNGNRIFSIDQSGNVRAAGTITGNVTP